MATVLSATGIEAQMAEENGSKLDAYEMEVAADKGDMLQDLAEFQLAAVRRQGFRGLEVGYSG